MATILNPNIDNQRFYDSEKEFVSNDMYSNETGGMSKELDKILKHKSDFDGCAIENNIIERVDVDTIAHFGNLTSFEIYCPNVVPYSSRNNTANLGEVIRAFIELMKLEEEDGIRLSQIKNVPCRLVFDGEDAWGSKVIGIGHFMQDRFVLIDDLATIGV